MLESITVKNFALIKEAELNLQGGLNVLSGETGAGKSLLLDSMNLALGSRSDSGLIRKGEDYAYVELVFLITDPEIEEKLKERDVYPEDHRIIASRRLTEGKSVSKINGETVTLAALREISGMLIDIHGQHDHQSLLKEENHLTVLDAYAKKEVKDAKENYLQNYQAYREMHEKIRKMGGDDQKRKKEIDFLAFEIEEIESAHLSDGEEEELLELRKKYSHAKRIHEGLNTAYEALSESASEAMTLSLREISELAQYDSELSGLSDQVREVDALLSDLLREIRDRRDEIDTDDEKLESVEERISDISKLKKKYGAGIPEILKNLKELHREHEELVQFDENKEQLLSDLEDRKALLLQASHELHAVRQKAAEAFSESMEEALKSLNFLQVRFGVEVRETSHYTRDGSDSVCFMISTNPGEPLKPLDKVASGGELSRIMLAIKSLVASSDRIPTMVFDEIDTGISGRTAAAVAERMQVISENHQVICISHLPQIVAGADHNYKIEKSVIDSETVTNIEELDSEQSLSELARLLGSGEVTKTTLENAREMKKTLSRK